MSISHERILNIILGNTPGLLGLQNDTLSYEVVNPAFAQFVGKAPTEILAKKDADLFGAEEAALATKEAQAVLRLGMPRTTRQTLTGRQGARWFEITRAPVFDEKGDPAGLFFLGLDITELREKAAAGEASVARLQEAEQALAKSQERATALETAQAALTTRVQELEQRNATLETEAASARTLEAQLAEVRATFETRIRECEAQREQAANAAGEADKQRQAVQERCAQLEAQREALRALAQQFSTLLSN